MCNGGDIGRDLFVLEFQVVLQGFPLHASISIASRTLLVLVLLRLLLLVSK